MCILPSSLLPKWCITKKSFTLELILKHGLSHESGNIDYAYSRMGIISILLITKEGKDTLEQIFQ